MIRNILYPNAKKILKILFFLIKYKNNILPNKINNIFIYYIKMLKIVLYSCNFGNYRDEKKNYEKKILDKNIDYYIFTDDTSLKVDGWNIIIVDCLPSDKIMSGYRWTTKFVKFILPDILKKYDIIIWADSKLTGPKLVSYDKIINLLTIYPDSEIFNLKHPCRNTMEQEIECTINYGMENKNQALNFLKTISNHVSKFSLPENCFFIRKNTEKSNDAFKYCFELMKTYGLKRDQNIYNYAMDMKNIIPVVLDDLKILTQN